MAAKPIPASHSGLARVVVVSGIAGGEILRAPLCEAIATVNRPVAAWIEWNLCHTTACAARGSKHLAASVRTIVAVGCATLRFARGATIRTATGFLGEALLGKEVLL